VVFQSQPPSCQPYLSCFFIKILMVESEACQLADCIHSWMFKNEFSFVTWHTNKIPLAPLQYVLTLALKLSSCSEIIILTLFPSRSIDWVWMSTPVVVMKSGLNVSSTTLYQTRFANSRISNHHKFHDGIIFLGHFVLKNLQTNTCKH
jgi:hypothetical protein